MTSLNDDCQGQGFSFLFCSWPAIMDKYGSAGPLKCIFIRQNISRKTECVLLLNVVYKLRDFIDDPVISLVFCRINTLFVVRY